MDVTQAKAGLANVRARMLAAHERQLTRTNLSDADRKRQEWAIATIKAAQVAKGEA